MKIIVAPDSFKGSLSAMSAAEAMARGVARVLPDAAIVIIPLADGGEGTLDALNAATAGTIHSISVTGPLGEPVIARYGLTDSGRTAIIEMAEAAGLTRVPVERRNPLLTTSFGVGELIRTAISSGCREIILGIGGSATHDCGTGALQALGARFTAHGQPMDDPITGAKLGLIDSIDLSDLITAKTDVSIRIACDVNNPLLGTYGAAQTYAPQKGATHDDVAALENATHRFIQIAERHTQKSVRNIPGSGAAGGLGAGFALFADAQLIPGSRLVLETCRFSARVDGADLVLTGEGRLDGQTLFGKTIAGILGVTRSKKIPVIAAAGTTDAIEPLFELGLTAAFSICSGPMTEEEAISHADILLEKITANILRCRYLDGIPKR